MAVRKADPGRSRHRRQPIRRDRSAWASPFRILAGQRYKVDASSWRPNQSFNNVESVASEKIGRETVTYVANIDKYGTETDEHQRKERERLRAAPQDLPAPR